MYMSININCIYFKNCGCKLKPYSFLFGLFSGLQNCTEWNYDHEKCLFKKEHPKPKIFPQAPPLPRRL